MVEPTDRPSAGAEQLEAPLSGACYAVAELHHAWLTGLVLTLVSRKDAATAERFVFRVFRTQHLELFLPGLRKLGLEKEPHAVAAAKYHYFSNQLGGVGVEFLEESDRKAWVRYPPPRWIWPGATLCGIPSEVNRAMLRGWHAHNGVTLGNPRLGFVCTGTTVDGDPGLEGYYREWDRDLAPEERLQFRPEERCPPIPRESLPRLDSADWPRERRAKAYRNYAMAYIRTALPIWVDLLGPVEARQLGGLCGRQIGMQMHDEVVSALAGAQEVPEDREARSFTKLLLELLRASGDRVEEEPQGLRHVSWRLFDGVTVDPVVEEMWLSVFGGLLAAHDRHLSLELTADRRLVVA